MAAPNPEKSLQDEATCSICLDYFQHPMMIIDCGHNFCRDCIAQCYAGSVNVLSCPQCRKPFPLQNIRPNRHLWNIVELAKQFSLRRASEAGEQKLCKKHQEPLKLFCEQDQTSICVVCDRSKLHKNHTVTPIEEAAHVYQEQIQHCLKTLKEERDKVLAFKSNAAVPSEDLLREAEVERQKLLSEFQQLHQVLKKKEQLLLDQLEKLEKEVEKRKEDHANNFSGEISRLNTLISELEQKCQEPPSGLLQDIGSILNRCRRSRFHPPTTPDSSELKKKLQEVSSESATLQAKLRTFRETLTEPKWIKENVTLDLATAHPRFIVSPNQKSVRWGTVRQELPYNARRFDPSRCVLGCQGFSSGRHQWTVDVNCGTSWAVGIARESVQRKGPFNIAPEEGIWALGFGNGHYKALTSPPTVLNQSKYMTKIQISLDYEGRSVAFFDADEKKSLFLFSLPRLKPDKIFPFFRVGDMNTILHLC
ncbi:zinc finger protein RFP-like isoform X2 [Varanus komodoensis]|uniref:Zinc finger protein RFP-like n=1 Tax=Varanus komodoensis TaxID=61221 RepID=A0A8D2LBP9_VARKO|nr:zinc finger protein RFP-like isoform X2 [Varanus komodoensis]